MNITYLIGNGFDLNLGLKTRYLDFYKYYLEQEGKDEIIKNFKKELSSSLENWSDLEISLGKYSKIFANREEDFMEILDDIQDNLAYYLKQQKINFEITDIIRSKIIQDIFSPSKYLNLREREKFNEYAKPYWTTTYIANLINFNYTQSIEEILGYKKGTPISTIREYNGSKYGDKIKNISHIHGTIERSMILGVNDISQIENPDFRGSRKLLNHFVKPQMNFDAGTLRDNEASTAIMNSDLICVYGMSLGETDKIWWQTICNRLGNSNARLIIFIVQDKIPPLREYLAGIYKDNTVDKILSYSNFTKESKEKIRNRIFVSINSDMFNIKHLIEERKSA